MKTDFDNYLKSCLQEDAERRKQNESELTRELCEICRTRRKCPNKRPCVTAETLAEGLKERGYHK